MNRISRVAGVCIVGALVAAAAAQALTAPGVIQITAVASKHTHVDEGTRGKSAGDVDVYTSLLYNTRITPKSIGHNSMVCTAVSASSQSCSATYFLPRGEIVVEGVIQSRLIYALAVTGGTDYYDNARGTLTVTTLHRSPERDLLVFRLLV